MCCNFVMLGKGGRRVGRKCEFEHNPISFYNNVVYEVFHDVPLLLKAEFSPLLVYVMSIGEDFVVGEEVDLQTVDLSL